MTWSEEFSNKVRVVAYSMYIVGLGLSLWSFWEDYQRSKTSEPPTERLNHNDEHFPAEVDK